MLKIISKVQKIKNNNSRARFITFYNSCYKVNCTTFTLHIFDYLKAMICGYNIQRKYGGVKHQTDIFFPFHILAFEHAIKVSFGTEVP